MSMCAPTYDEWITIIDTLIRSNMNPDGKLKEKLRTLFYSLELKNSIGWNNMTEDKS